MLPKHYRFVVENLTGVTIAVGGVDLSIVRVKTGPTDSAVEPEASAVALTNAGSVANNSFGVIGATQDNSVGKFIEGNGNYKVVTTGSPSGDVRLYMQTSPDGTEWPDDALASISPAVINFTSATTKDTDFEF